MKPTQERRYWTPEEDAILRQHYPDTPTKDLAVLLKRNQGSVWCRANTLVLKKSAAYFESDKTSRIQRGRTDPRMLATQIKPGNVPWNAGRKGWQAGGRSAETRFSAGQEPPNTLPLGGLRVVTNNGVSQLERKVSTQSGPSNRRWKAVHRLVWEAANGPVPAGHIIVFKPGMKTLVEAQITLDKVDCITRAENARRNDPSTKNPELKKLYQLKGAITRQVNRITQEQTA